MIESKGVSKTRTRASNYPESLCTYAFINILINQSIDRNTKFLSTL